LVPCGPFPGEAGTLLDPQANGALDLCVIEWDQEPERELRDNWPAYSAGKRLPHLHLGQTRIARFEIRDECAKPPPAFRLARDRFTRRVVVEDAMQIDEIAWLIAIAHRMKFPRAHIPKGGHGYFFTRRERGREVKRGCTPKLHLDVLPFGSGHCRGLI
jgi:hypothetical protein